jgi:hypothetical protein
MNIKLLSASMLFLIMLVNNCFAQDTIYMRNDQRIACTIVEVTTTEVKYKKLELSDGPVYIENKSSVALIRYKNGFIDVFKEVKTLPEPVKKEEDDYVQDRKNTRNGNDDYAPDPRKKKLIVIGTNHFLYGDKRLNEKGMQQLLLSVNDPQITQEVKRAKLDKGLKYIGFLAIPLALVAIASAVQINTYSSPNYNNGYTSTRNDGFIAPAVICTVGAAAAFSASIYFGIDRKARNARAVRLYQQKYEGR